MTEASEKKLRTRISDSNEWRFNDSMSLFSNSCIFVVPWVYYIGSCVRKFSCMWLKEKIWSVKGADYQKET